MAGFNPITSILGAVTDAVGLTQSSRGANRAYKQAADAYNQQTRETAAQYKAERDKLELDAAQAANDRRNALRRAVAKQQASFGGQGISAADGSGEAVMLGLLRESDAEKQYRDRLDTIKRESLSNAATNENRRSLLALKNSYDNSYDRFLNSTDSMLGVFN